MNRQENLVNVIDFIRVDSFATYLLEFSDLSHNDDTRTILKDLLGNINFRITRNLQTPQALITCSFEHSSNVHIFVLMPLFYSVNALRGVVDWQGVYKHYFPIYRLMTQLSLEIENFDNFPEPGIYVRCAVGRKLMISLVGGRDRHWSFLNMIVGHFFLIPRIFRNTEVGILYEIRWSNDVLKLASLCLKNILSSGIKNGISRLLHSPLAFH
jgi:hypothetical protein